MGSVKERLKQVMDAMGLKPLTPASTCDGITKSMLQKIWASDTDTITSKFLVPFCERYSKVNCNWLIRGVGDMFINDGENKNTSEVNSPIKLSDNADNYYKHILRELLNADMAIAEAELRKKELYAQIADKI